MWTQIHTDSALQRIKSYFDSDAPDCSFLFRFACKISHMEISDTPLMARVYARKGDWGKALSMIDISEISLLCSRF